MSIVFKTTITPSAPVVDHEAMAAMPIDEQTLLEALGDAMGMLAAKQRREWEQEFGAMRQKIANLEGRIDVLVSLTQGKGQAVDLPPLPKLFEASSQQTIRKLRVSR
jgi:hypothetical protein